jgi:hypothetical protein
MLMMDSQSLAETVFMTTSLSQQARTLLPELELLRDVRTVSAVRTLAPALLQSLIDFESQRIALMEWHTEMLDGFTGGHHRDRLNFYHAVLHGQPIDEAMTLLTITPEFDFSLSDFIAEYATAAASSPQSGEGE